MGEYVHVYTCIYVLYVYGSMCISSYLPPSMHTMYDWPFAVGLHGLGASIPQAKQPAQQRVQAGAPERHSLHHRGGLYRH